jgi:hypothetical protein
MPTYPITDVKTGEVFLVDAAKPAGALAAVVGERYTIGAALDAAEAMDMLQSGATRIDARCPIAEATMPEIAGKQKSSAADNPVAAGQGGGGINPALPPELDAPEGSSPPSDGQGEADSTPSASPVSP